MHFNFIGKVLFRRATLSAALSLLIIVAVLTIFMVIKIVHIANKYEPPHEKTSKMNVHPAKTQISLGICPVWSGSSLCTQWVAKDPSFLHADSEDSDQTGRMPRLIWVFAGRTTTLFVLSWGGSIIVFKFNLQTMYFGVLVHYNQAL